MASAFKLSELFLSDEEFDIARGVGTKSEIVEPEFPAPNSDERAFELNMMIANETNFWTRKHHATSQLFVERVVEMGTTIDGDGIGDFLFLHVYNYSTIAIRVGMA